jgi:hypothetical protein
MEQTLRMHLAKQRNAIREAIIEEPQPENMGWESKIAWERARIRFTQIVDEAGDADV